MVVAACSAEASEVFGASETVVKSRPVIDRREPDLPNKTAVVIRSEDARATLKMLCTPDKGLSAEIDFAKSVIRGDANHAIRMTYRADDGAPSEDVAWPTGDRDAILANARQILTDGLNAAALHIRIRIVDGPTASMIFRPRDAVKALAKIQSNCPSDAPPPDQNGLAR